MYYLSNPVVQKMTLSTVFKRLLLTTTTLSPRPCQVSDYSKESRGAVCCCHRLVSPAATHSLRPPHNVPRAAEGCPAGGGGAEAVQLQRYTDARGDGRGVRYLCDGPASTQSTDPGGLCDAATQQHPHGARRGRTGAALHGEEQAQNHAMYSGVNVAL